MEHFRHLSALANRENAEVETFHVRKEIMSVRIFSNELTDVQNTVEEGIGIRTAKDSRIGFSSTNNPSSESLEKSFRSALNLAKASRRIPGWLGFPTQQKAHSKAHEQAPKGTVLATEKAEETIDLALRMIKQAVSRSKIACALTGSLVTVLEKPLIMNSSGLEHELEASSAFNTRIIIEARTGENHCTTEGRFCSSRLSDFKPEEEVGKMVSEASELLEVREKRVSNGKRDVILSPASAGAFICYLVAPMITSTSALTGASCLTNMLNKTVASESVSMADDGRAEGGIASAAVDDEGTPTRSTEIFERGVFRNFLYDILTASLGGSRTTGNARRISDPIGRTYLAPPEPLATNLVLRPGDVNLEELLEMTSSGLVINSIGYTFHLVPELGYFNIVSNNPILVVEKGRVVGRTRNASISGRLVETLQSIDGIGKMESQSLFLGSVATFSPHLRIKNMTVESAGY